MEKESRGKRHRRKEIKGTAEILHMEIMKGTAEYGNGKSLKMAQNKRNKRRGGDSTQRNNERHGEKWKR